MRGNVSLKRSKVRENYGFCKKIKFSCYFYFIFLLRLKGTRDTSKMEGLTRTKEIVWEYYFAFFSFTLLNFPILVFFSL